MHLPSLSMPKNTSVLSEVFRKIHINEVFVSVARKKIMTGAMSSFFDYFEFTALTTHKPEA